MMKKVALVIGATGATGTALVPLLVNDPSFSMVKLFVRRKIALTHPKLEIHVIDFETPKTWEQDVQGDVLFSALGTTLKAVKTKEAQRKVDYDYQYQFAQIAQKNGVRSLVLVSSVGANPNDFFFYYRLKGELDRDVAKLNFLQTFIFRPPVLIRPYSTRTVEVFLVRFLTGLNRLGLFKAAAPLAVDDLAKAMIKASKSTETGLHILEKEEIRYLANS